jgi:hypothetical protein
MCAVTFTVLPGKRIGSFEATPRATIASVLRETGWAERNANGWRFKLPTVCVVNGQPVLQKNWNKTRIKKSDTVAFFSKPLGGRGGKGSSVLGLVAIIGLSLIAGPLAGALLPASIANASIFGVTGAKLFASAFPSGGNLLSR